MPNAQELICHLENYRLKTPTTDRWESIFAAVRDYLDCFVGGTVHTRAHGRRAHVFVDGKALIDLQFDNAAVEPLSIRIVAADDEATYRPDFYDET